MKTELDWSNYHDQGMGDAYADIPKHGANYAKAISVCIKSGVCLESNNRGVMCPSFRLDQDQALSPSARVQLFKDLLNQNDHSFIHDPNLEHALSSCVSCKGCKRECENNIDMAAIKFEYLAQRKAAGYGSIRSWLFAEFPYLLHKFPALLHLIVLRNRYPILRQVSKWIFKINPRIDLPVPTAKQNKTSFNSLSLFDNKERNIILLVDSFTDLFSPQNATDAKSVLSALGYNVTLLAPSDGNKRPLDSGRSLLSQGYVKRTKQQAHELLAELAPYIKQGQRIIGLEPSALLMLRDEYLMLELGEVAQELALSSLLFEEFIAKEHMAGRIDFTFIPSKLDQKILVHGHCHQKAVGAMKSMRKVLRLIPNLNFEFIEASCCGMAGSFGLEVEHADESHAMAAQQLLPALDKDPSATIVCNGFSCSHQIYALRGRTPLHLANLLAQHLPSGD